MSALCILWLWIWIKYGKQIVQHSDTSIMVNQKMEVIYSIVGPSPHIIVMIILRLCPAHWFRHNAAIRTMVAAIGAFVLAAWNTWDIRTLMCMECKVINGTLCAPVSVWDEYIERMEQTTQNKFNDMINHVIRCAAALACEQQRPANGKRANGTDTKQ